MGLKKIVDEIKKEVKVLKGEETKDKTYTNETKYPDATTARKQFELAKQKLFAVNDWSNISGFESTFTLYDPEGNKVSRTKPQIGDYIEIVLPATSIDNWVQVTDVHEEENMADFVVHPSKMPAKLAENQQEVKHFFSKEASSTFRVELQGTTLIASELGRNEGINNQGEEAGDRAILNTLVAEGGWAQMQQIHWDILTRYLVHQHEGARTSL
ncbi:hypothetical protein [Pontibacter liquoris]|uniref:hypothetical protein n=1 Tax=Pontibacter liquoris TaxID=2905677 RepID=UPI001FA6D5FC|nr:hypothetical protein [Pontibacter liquoris]